MAQPAHQRAVAARGWLFPVFLPAAGGEIEPVAGAGHQVPPSDRAFLATLLHRLPRDMLGRFRLLIRPDTVLRWHRDLLARRHAARSRPKAPRSAAHRPLHPPPGAAPGTRESLLRLPPHPRRTPRARHQDRRLHRWEILQQAGIDPVPERTSTTWASFLRSQADALLACDFFETVTLTAARLYALGVIKHASRRIRILGVTPHPTACWIAQAARNPVMDLEDSGSRARFLIRDRDGKFPGLFDAMLKDAGNRMLAGSRHTVGPPG